METGRMVSVAQAVQRDDSGINEIKSILKRIIKGTGPENKGTDLRRGVCLLFDNTFFPVK